MKTFDVNIAGVKRELPIVPVGGNVSVALFNMLGDTEVTEAAGKELARQLPSTVEILVTPEVKALTLAHVLSRESNKPYVVIRKTQKPYMVNPKVNEVVSITTGKPQTLVLDGIDIERLKGKKVAIVDDVVSSGGTLHSLSKMMQEVGAEVVAVLAVFTEGEKRDNVIALGHLPLF